MVQVLEKRTNSIPVKGKVIRKVVLRVEKKPYSKDFGSPSEGGRAGSGQRDRPHDRPYTAPGRHGHARHARVRSPWLKRVKAELAAQYVDHNILHTDFKNADDHKFLQTAAARYGIHFSGAGNGVSHQVHMERFGVPGKTLLGADSHTTGAAGVSMLGIGAGGLDVALAMAGFPYYLPCPRARRQADGKASRLGECQGRDPGNAAAL